MSTGNDNGDAMLIAGEDDDNNNVVYQPTTCQMFLPPLTPAGNTTTTPYSPLPATPNRFHSPAASGYGGSAKAIRVNVPMSPVSSSSSSSSTGSSPVGLSSPAAAASGSSANKKPAAKRPKISGAGTTAATSNNAVHDDNDANVDAEFNSIVDVNAFDFTNTPFPPGTVAYMHLSTPQQRTDLITFLDYVKNSTGGGKEKKSSATTTDNNGQMMYERTSSEICLGFANVEEYRNYKASNGTNNAATQETKMELCGYNAQFPITLPESGKPRYRWLYKQDKYYSIQLVAGSMSVTQAMFHSCVMTALPLPDRHNKVVDGDFSVSELIPNPTEETDANGDDGEERFVPIFHIVGKLADKAVFVFDIATFATLLQCSTFSPGEKGGIRICFTEELITIQHCDGFDQMCLLAFAGNNPAYKSLDEVLDLFKNDIDDRHRLTLTSSSSSSLHPSPFIWLPRFEPTAVLASHKQKRAVIKTTDLSMCLYGHANKPYFMKMRFWSSASQVESTHDLLLEPRGLLHFPMPKSQMQPLSNTFGVSWPHIEKPFHQISSIKGSNDRRGDLALRHDENGVCGIYMAMNIKFPAMYIRSFWCISCKSSDAEEVA